MIAFSVEEREGQIIGIIAVDGVQHSETGFGPAPLDDLESLEDGLAAVAAAIRSSNSNQQG